MNPANRPAVEASPIEPEAPEKPETTPKEEPTEKTDENGVKEEAKDENGQAKE